MDTNTLLVFLLVALGLGIIMAEVFIPSAGVLSIMALCCFAGSAFCAWKAWYATEQYGYWWGYVFSMVIGVPSLIGTGLYILPRTQLGRNLLAAPQDLEEVTPFQEEESRLSELINQTGVAVTMFSPGGMVQIGRDRLHAESEGVLIDPGTEIMVVGVRGNRLVVRPTSLESSLVANAEANSDSVPEPSTEPTEEEQSSIDFDVPDST